MAATKLKAAATQGDVKILRDSLRGLPDAQTTPLFIVLVGLPGTGKTFLARRLSQRFPLAVLESDALRKTLFRKPSHSAEESAALFDACHELIAELLEERIPVILDATNLVEANRQVLYDIADGHGAALFIVKVHAPRGVVKRRLALRVRAKRTQEHSQADWGVYKRMLQSEERIGRSHYEVDTSGDIEGFIDRLAGDLQKYLEEQGRN